MKHILFYKLRLYLFLGKKFITIDNIKYFIEDRRPSNGLIISNILQQYIIKYCDNYIRFCKNGKCHRENGPATIFVDGAQFWVQNDQLHRVDAPAVINTDGSKEWWLHDKYHREDGPAFLTLGKDMNFCIENFYLLGKKYSKEDYYLINKFPYLW
jgi:hypothetical protein